MSSGHPNDTTADIDPHGTGELCVLVSLDGVVTEHALPVGGELKVGRSRTCDVVIDHVSISRFHATLRSSPLEIIDARSHNGIRLRGEQLPPGVPTPVAIGETIQLGAATLLIRHRESAPVVTDYVPPEKTGQAVARQLDAECGRSARSAAPFAYVRIEVDPDRAGVAFNHLRASLRPSDVAGADARGSFHALLLDSPPEQTTITIARLIYRLRRAGVEPRVAMARYPHDGTTAEQLSAHAWEQLDAQAGADPSAMDERPRARRAGRGGRAVGADHRRDRRRQGAVRRDDPPPVGARGTAVREAQLRRDRRVAARERAVRSRARRVHRRDRRDAGPVRGRRRRHGVPRRDRRAAARRCRRSCCACSRSASCAASARAPAGRSTCASSARPTACSPTRSRPAGSAATCTTGSTASRSRSRRCASAATRSPGSRVHSRCDRAPAGRRRRRSAPTRSTRSRSTRGPATSASCATRSSAPCCSRAPVADPARAPRARADHAADHAAAAHLDDRDGRGRADAGGPPSGDGASLTDAVADFERRRIIDALERHGGNQTRAAHALGISRGMLLTRLNAYGLPRPRKG